MPMNYEDMFGNTPMAAFYGFQDRDREIEKHNSSQLMQAEQLKQQQLANMFAEQNNPITLEKNQLGLDYTRQTQPAKISSELSEYAGKAKQEELDEMYREGQRMLFEGAKANNQEMMTMGERIIMAHKDFIKLRETGQQKVDLQNDKQEAAERLARLKANLKPATVGKGGSSGAKPVKYSSDQMRGYWMQKMEAAKTEEEYTQAVQMIDYITSQMMATRPDTNAGKPTISPSGQIATTPPRAAPQAPPFGGRSTQAPAPSAPQKHKLADVQKMYPGVPAEKLREAYKKKFGVDLQ